MYDELIEALRLCVKHGKAEDALENAKQAADAIEELSAIREEQKAQIIAMAAEDKPRWIPTTEQLPEEKTFVLILFDTISGKMSGVSFLYKDGDGHNCWTWLDRLGKNLFDIQPTHWQPLPEPPKEG